MGCHARVFVGMSGAGKHAHVFVGMAPETAPNLPVPDNYEAILVIWGATRPKTTAVRLVPASRPAHRPTRRRGPFPSWVDVRPSKS